jgi:hypothetical protein
VAVAWWANTVLSRMPNRASNPSRTATIKPGPHGLGDALGAYAMGLAEAGGRGAGVRESLSKGLGRWAGKAARGVQRSGTPHRCCLCHQARYAFRAPSRVQRRLAESPAICEKGLGTAACLQYKATNQRPAGACWPPVSTHRPRESNGPTVGPVWCTPAGGSGLCGLRGGRDRAGGM